MGTRIGPGPTMRAACIAIAIAGWGAGCAKQEPAAAPVSRPVRAIQVEAKVPALSRSFPGRAKAAGEVNLAFRVAGTLAELPVIVGQSMEAGAVVARLDPRDFEVSLRTAEGQVEAATARLALLDEQLQRMQTAYEQKAISEIEMVRTRQEREQTLGQLTTLNAQVEAAQDALSYTTLRAPFAGTIVATFVENFEDVNVRQAIVRLLDDDYIEVVVEIPEDLAARVAQGIEVTCLFSALPGVEIAGAITEIGTEASSVTRTFPVTIRLPQPEESKLLAGMTCECRARRPAGSDEAPLIAVPVPAVLTDEGGAQYVWVVDEASGRVARRDVVVGALTERGLEVQGVEPGEWVATAGGHFLEEGQTVTLLGRETSS